MIRVLIWTLGIYAVWKLAQLLISPSAGYGSVDPPDAPRKRTSDLVMIAVALVLATLITTYTRWWTHRLAEREYAHAKGCYAQVEAAYRLPRLARQIDISFAERNANSYFYVAEQHGAMLGMRGSYMDDDLRRHRDAVIAHYAPLAAANDQPQLRALLADVERCFNDDWAPHGQIFNP